MDPRLREDDERTRGDDGRMREDHGDLREIVSLLTIPLVYL